MLTGMAKQRSKVRIILSALAAVLTGGLALVRRHRRQIAGGGPPEGGGGLAGVREPRRPIPPTLTTVGAPTPAE